ncbi:hypothetical protein JXC34_03890 [Candidatus Woesearchaeota archaeon]|nr:hypothetical protein [Candidatus Woesearchaeota archaeon]
MIDKNQVLSFVKENGPVIPRDVVKEVGGDTFFVGAVLSQLVDNKQIKISSAKIGGSPVYYYSGQEHKLEILYKFLHEKEKRAYDLLKETKILRDNHCEPVIRVALRNIKDFAKPLEVVLGERKEIFWKWHLVSNQEAEQIIRGMLGKELQEKKASQAQEEPKQEKRYEETTKKEPKTEEKEPIAETKQEKTPRQETLEPEPRKQSTTQPKKEEDHELLSNLNSVFDDKGIEILETEVIRKNSDIEMIIRIPSPVGRLRYFCKVRDKKRCNDKDLSSAYVEGQMKKLPVLFVTTGELTKKAKEMQDKEFKMISVLYI